MHGMRVTVRKWGNSASLRIPSAMMRAVGLELDQPVELIQEGDRLIIEPVSRPRYDLAALLDAITDDNRHDEVETGAAIGKEAW